MKKVALHNLGCKVNAYETEAMQEMLEHAGYEIDPRLEASTKKTSSCSSVRLLSIKTTLTLVPVVAKIFDGIDTTPANQF